MRTYTITFQGFNGTRNKTVEVKAARPSAAVLMARLDNPGWSVVESVKWPVAAEAAA